MKIDPTKADAANTSSFLSDIIDTLTERGRVLLGRKASGAIPQIDLVALGELLLSRRGEASGVALAQTLLASYNAASGSMRLDFARALAQRFGPSESQIDFTIEAWRNNPGPDTLNALHAASEPRRQELIRRLNLAPGGTSALVRMREELLEFLPKHPELKCVDADFSHLLSSWFNRGFLVLRPIDWTTPANILEKIIRYEAVHAIQNWDDLRNRLQPEDRRCYGFFHPQLVDEPLIFVEVALTKETPGAIGPLLDLGRTPIAASEATTAVFYSISNTQKGLSGVSFGNFLIKQVVENLKRELPNLKMFVTLSPVPGFARWLERERKTEQ
ncbi:MAG: malonyl-CoA decarboxylase family protein, partial [Microvirga sp.]